eukprot:7347959-Heterocapsa_arctica.AAC.1
MRQCITEAHRALFPFGDPGRRFSGCQEPHSGRPLRSRPREDRSRPGGGGSPSGTTSSRHLRRL